MAAEAVRIEIPIETIDETEPELSRTISRLGKLGKAEKEAGQSATRASGEVSKFDRSLGRMGQKLDRMTRGRFQLLLEAKDRIAPILSSLGKRLRSFTGRVWRVTVRAADYATRPIRGILRLLKNPLLSAGAMLGVGIGVKDSIETYGSFQKQMSKVGAISGATGNQMEMLTAKAKEMGEATKFTAAQAGEAFQYMAMAGWKTKDMMSGISGIMDLSAASGEELGKVSDIVTDAMTAFGMSADGMTKDGVNNVNHFADVLAAASSNSNTSVGMMGETFKYAANAAGALGYSVEDTALAIGMMANTGLKSSMAGTALQQIIQRLSTNMDGARDKLEAMGISFYNAQNEARPLGAIIDELRKKTAGFNGKQMSELTKALGGTRGGNGLKAILSHNKAGIEGYEKLKQAIDGANGSSKEMAGTMINNMSGALTILQSKVDSVKISFGQRLEPYVVGFANWVKGEMPNIEKGLGSFMDEVDSRVDRIKRTMKELMSTRKWQSSGFFGKIGLSWNKLVAEPFSKWWDSTGKSYIADKLAGIGEGIGKAFNAGILTLLGFDVADVIDEGASVGARFAKGFADGFDFNAISEKLWEGFGNLFNNALRLLPGGESPGLSSLLSAGLLVRILSPLFRGGTGLFRAGKSIAGMFGGATAAAGTTAAAGGAEAVAGGVAGVGLLRSIIGDTGNAMVRGSGILGKLAHVGYTLNPGNTAGLYFGSTEGMMSGGAAAAVGGAGVIGGALGVAGLAKGGYDLYTGLTSDDAAKQKAYMSAAGKELIGTGGGALAGVGVGAAIGALGGPIGMALGGLIGAGVGAIGGIIAGKHDIDEYDESVENARKAMEATGLSIDKLNFKSKALDQALNDTEVSADELKSMFQEAVAMDMEQHFGDLALSLGDVRKAASNIVYGGQLEKVSKYAEAAQDALSSYNGMSGWVTQIQKVRFTASLGNKMDSSTMTEFMSAYESYAQSAKEYIRTRHIEVSAAVDFLFGDEGNEITKGYDKMFGTLEEKISKKSDKLSKVIKKAIEDGFISPDEQKAIDAINAKIAKITGEINAASEEAALNAITVKYNGEHMSSTSFNSLQEELKTYSAEFSENASNSYSTLYGAWKQKYKGRRGSDKAQRELEKIENNYQAQIASLNDRVVGAQVDQIAKSYEHELDKVLPGMEGSTSEKLMAALQVAVTKQSNASKWDDTFLSEMFGINTSNLNTETYESLRKIIKDVGSTITVPDGLKEKMISDIEDALPTAHELYKNINFDKMTIEDYSKLVGNYDVLSKLDDKQRKENAIDFFEKDRAIELGQPDFKFTDSDVKETKEALSTYLSMELRNAMRDQGGFPVEIKLLDKYILKNGEKDVREKIQNAADLVGTITTDADLVMEWNLKNTGIRSIIENKINEELSGWRSQIHDAPAGGGNDSGGKGGGKKPKHNAAGGYVGGKTLSWLGEEGYGEFVIPTNPMRRKRAVELWKQAGDTLGVSKNAAGGFIGGHNAFGSLEGSDSESTGYYGAFIEPTSIIRDAKSQNNISVSVNVSPAFEISSGDSKSVMDEIRANMDELSDEVAGSIAERLEGVFSNMPATMEA